MEKKKKTNWFKIALLGLFIIYISLYALNVTGYYDGAMRRKVEFTNSQIQQFESDIEKGEIVDLNDYLKEQNKDYTNTVSRFGYAFSKNVDDFLNKGIKDVIKFLGKLLS